MGASQSVPASIVRCVVCEEIYSDPCTLDCGHTFCRRCISRYMYLDDKNRMGETCLCPRCEETTVLTVPGKSVDLWIKELKPSVIVSRLVKNNSGEEDTNICFMCKDKKTKAPGKLWCHVCDMAMCDICHDAHSRIPSSRDHDVSKINADIIANLKFRCQKHPKYTIRWLCKFCDTTICAVCRDVEHRKCDGVVSLESLMPKLETKLLRMSEKFTQTVDVMTNVINGKRTLVKEREKEADEITATIIKTCEEARYRITQREDELKQEVKDKTKEEVKKLQDQIKSGELELQTPQQYMAYMELMKKDRQPLEVYNLLSMIEKGGLRGPSRIREKPLMKCQLMTSQHELESALPKWIRLESTNV